MVLLVASASEAVGGDPDQRAGGGVLVDRVGAPRRCPIGVDVELVDVVEAMVNLVGCEPSAEVAAR